MGYWSNTWRACVNVIELAHQALKPLPYLSLLVDDCTERGLDVSAGGARYNFAGVQAVGLGTSADSLAVIKYLVFNRQLVSGRDMLDALNANWDRFEYLFALVNGSKVPHYGNDDPYADELARYAADLWCREVAGRPSAHGGVFQPGLFSASSNVPFGRMMSATPDGRRAGEPLSDGISPVHNALGSHDYEGITATINSVARLDQEAASNGALLNLRIKPNSLRGDNADTNLASLIKAYFGRGGMHLQVDVVNREVLLDAEENPQDYPGLLVYVAGYSTLWDELGDGLKREIIARSELAFDDNTDLTPPD
jgi:formate C-acetyltransferase